MYLLGSAPLNLVAQMQTVWDQHSSHNKKDTFLLIIHFLKTFTRKCIIETDPSQKNRFGTVGVIFGRKKVLLNGVMRAF